VITVLIKESHVLGQGVSIQFIWKFWDFLHEPRREINVINLQIVDNALDFWVLNATTEILHLVEGPSEILVIGVDQGWESGASHSKFLGVPHLEVFDIIGNFSGGR
jgi:hypothetical protein